MKTKFHFKGVSADWALSYPARAQPLAQSQKITILKLLFVPTRVCAPLDFLKGKYTPSNAATLLPIPHPCEYRFIVFPQGCFCSPIAGNYLEASSSSAVSLLTNPVWLGLKSVRTAQLKPL